MPGHASQHKHGHVISIFTHPLPYLTLPTRLRPKTRLISKISFLMYSLLASRKSKPRATYCRSGHTSSSNAGFIRTVRYEARPRRIHLSRRTAAKTQEIKKRDDRWLYGTSYTGTGTCLCGSTAQGGTPRARDDCDLTLPAGVNWQRP